MKNSIWVIILVIACLGLGVGLIATKKKAAEQIKNDGEVILTLSNKWVETRTSLDDQRQQSAMLEKDLETAKQAHEKAYTELSNSLSQANATLTANLAKSESALKAAQDEMARRDARITELESQNQALDKQALDLSTAITNLTVQIADTQRKLAASEGDKAFLEKELKRLMGEKAELERQFNDLAVLRAQVAKLKEELSIARRIEWIRQGLFANADQKGAQKLMQGLTVAQSKPKANYDLNVEVNADGSVKVVSPLTNAPAAKVPATIQ